MLLTLAGTALAALVLGLPTAIIPNPIFERVIPAGPSNYIFWASTSVVTGILLATYALPRGIRDRASQTGIGGGLLGFLAIAAQSATRP